MKTRNFILFVLTAVVCGAFLCADSQARVCFAGDESCEVGGFFDALPSDDLNDSACVAEGYIKDKTCLPGEIAYTCPYKSSYKKCCGAEYKYEACVYPLEQTGRCGTRVSCKCPDDYSVTSEYASNNYCQPGGGYCMANNGVDDEIKYKTCTCDPSVFVEEGDSCPNNQEVSKTCTGIRWKNAQKTVKESYKRVDCYCKRGSISSADPYKASKNDEYPFSNCTYGHKGTNTCIDSNTKREYYNECRSPEEACIADGYEYTDCSAKRNCQTASTVYWNGKYQKLTSPNCIAGELCPYPTNPGLYTCVFDKTSWCVSNDFTQTTSSKPTNGQACTTPDGIPGEMVVCPGNDNNSLFYYKCKIRCDQRMKKEVGLSLQPDTRFGSWADSQGQVWNSAYWVKLDNPKGGFKSGYHLFLRGDYRLPDAGQAYDNKASGNKVVYADSKSANGRYASINGIGALYLLDPVKYSDCKEEYENSGGRSTSKRDSDIWYRNYNPKLKIPLSYDNDILSRDFNNIDIVLDTHNDQGVEKDWMGRSFEINKRDGDKVTTYVWRNVGLIHQMPSDFSSEISDSSRIYYSKDRTLMMQAYGTKIKFMGDTYFEAINAYYQNKTHYPDHVDGDGNQPYGMLTFHGNDYHILEFKDADMAETYSGESVDIDTGENGSVLVVDSSNVLFNNVFSYINVDVRNKSTFTASALNTLGRHDSYGRTTAGMFNRGRKYCIGNVVTGGSKVNVNKTIMEVYDNRYLYVSGGSSVNSTKPIRLRTAGNSVACIADSSSSITSYGTKYDTSTVSNYTLGSWSPKITYKSSGRRIIYSGGDAGCLPYTQNSKWDSSSTYKKHCTGYKRSSDADMLTNNNLDDSGTYNTPAYMRMSVRYSGSPNNYDTSTTGYYMFWYPRLEAKCSDCTTMLSCKDRGASYSNIVEGYCGYGASGNYDAAGPRWMGAVRGYYYRCHNSTQYCANSNKYSYNCSGTNRFLCSGCSYCDEGIAYSDWTDVSGGFATEQKVDPLDMQ